MAEFFDVLTSIINKKPISDEDIKKHYTGFVTNKWLSNNPMACYVVNQVQSTRGNKFIPVEAEYRFLKNSIKMNNNTRLAFDKNDKCYNTIIETVKSIYNVGNTTAEEYIKILGGKRLVAILEKRAMLSNTHTSDNTILSLREAINNKKNDLLKIKGV